MENNTNETVDTTQQNPASIDYKAEYEKLVSERDNFKALKDKYSKESAEWKNKYTSTLSDVELAKNQQEERDAYTKSLEEKVASVILPAIRADVDVLPDRAPSVFALDFGFYHHLQASQSMAWAS